MRCSWRVASLFLLAPWVGAQPIVVTVPAPSLMPDAAHAIPLSSPAHPSAPEQWENLHGEQIVRNVSASTLTPVLPDPAKANGAAIIVAPGGAFLYLSMDHEGYGVAHWLADHGIAAFVLKYRTRETPRDPRELSAALASAIKNGIDAEGHLTITTPPDTLDDAKAAVRLVRTRAAEWKIDPSRVGFLGFSAGAVTAMSVGLIDDKAARPDFIAPIYGPQSKVAVPPDAPPLFDAVALDDGLMTRGKLELVDAWREAHRPVEAHFYAHGGHGFGVTGRGAASAQWLDELRGWMIDSKFIAASTQR